jgi:hypothetical protein
VVKENRRSRRKTTINFFIDSGAVLSLVPGSALRKLGIRRYREADFSLADATSTRRVDDAYFQLQGEGAHGACNFGEKDHEPLLGATTLERTGLVLDPFKRRLIPMRMMLA